MMTRTETPNGYRKELYRAFCPACQELIEQRRPCLSRKMMAFKCKCGCNFTAEYKYLYRPGYPPNPPDLKQARWA